MIYQTRAIARDVRVALDENRASEVLLMEDDRDTLSVDEIILSKIEEGVRRIVSIAPTHLLSGGAPFGDGLIWKELHGRGESKRYGGWILLPEDFMRLLLFKMSDWERPVTQVLTAGDSEYDLQHSRYGGLRGTPQKPKVAIIRRQEGLSLEFYSCRSREARVEQGLYYKIPKIDDDGGIWIPERLYRGAVYEIGSRTLATLGRTDLAGVMRELAEASCE